MAPGVTRTSVTDNTGIVEAGLRTDPKVITITATQRGISDTYRFDFNQYCNNRPTPKPPVLTQPIPDQYLAVGQSFSGSGFQLGLYFADPTPYAPGYSSGWTVNVDGLPDGLSIFALSTPGNSPNPVRTILGSPKTTGVYTVTVTVSTAAFSASPIRTTFSIIVTNGQPPVSTLLLSQPTYTCETGRIVFNTTGGDGSPITFIAPGITRSLATSNVGVVEPELRNDPKPITIEAIQTGHTSTYTFDFAAYCAGPHPPSGTGLTWMAPTYNCQTGAIHFNTSGGDGSPIEFRAPGITDWTVNPDQFVDKESRSASDVQPFTLAARQSGQIFTYVWDLKATCGRARVGLPDPVPGLTVVVLGNPVENQTAEIEVSGVSGSWIELNVLDLQGRVLHQERISQADVRNQVSIPLNMGKGLLLLQVQTATEHQQVRLVKP